jgi:acyl transferase domain-containing protein/NAD(P)-dependent dehydrogenase (short-subunit alcohol dehydrogenase family)
MSQRKQEDGFSAPIPVPGISVYGELKWRLQTIDVHQLNATCQNVQLFLTDPLSRFVPESEFAKCTAFAARGDELDQWVKQTISSFLFSLQEWIKKQPKVWPFFLILLDEESAQFLAQALRGVLMSAAQENGLIQGRVLVVSPSMCTMDQLYAEASHALSIDWLVRHDQDGSRWAWGYGPLDLPSDQPNPVDHVLKESGVYWITGGAGKLGLALAEYFLSVQPAATVVLTGRSDLTPAQDLIIGRLNQKDLDNKIENASRVFYFKGDVCDKNTTRALFNSITEQFGHLNGVVHAAGIVRDSFLIKKTAVEANDVLSVKVSGMVNVDEATKDAELDFFIAYSSVYSLLGNAGQSDYAAANGFLDGYTEYRNKLVQAGRRKGRTISMHWPLWQAGGMQIDPEFVRAMEFRLGLQPLPTDDALHAFADMMSSTSPQPVVVFGEIDALEQRLLHRLSPKKMAPFPTARVPPSAGNDHDTIQLSEKIEYRLKTLIGQFLKIPLDSMMEHDSLEDYGFDSIIIAKLNEKLAPHFENLSKTLFYECLSLADLTHYLIDRRLEESMRWVGWSKKGDAGAGGKAMDQKQERRILVKRTERTERTEPTAAARSSASVAMPLTVAPHNTAIAVIGLVGQYPHAKDIDAYWNNLAAGVDAVGEIPKNRWDWAAYFDPEKAMPGKSYGKWGGFIDGVDEFDPLFFNISPKEAEEMDPQERLFLQACWHVLEDAGYTPQNLIDHVRRRQGEIGVFAGVTKSTYQLLGPEAWARGNHVSPNSLFWHLANRVSYLFDFHGPSMPIDTACSSSLTAIHQACESIRNGECGVAIAGGINLYLHPASYISLSQMTMLSTDGKCRSFGAGGDGFVPGEGVGCLLLKPLQHAREDGDHIYGVIRSTAINHDGKTNGYTVPNPSAQARLVSSALRAAQLSAEQVSYVEAHGTGTILGDPIEVTGLTQAFREDSERTGFCSIGSAKSNIGHLEGAAGIAGVTKVLLQMKHGKLAPTLHAKVLNPNINFNATPFVVQQKLADWAPTKIREDGTATPIPRIAGVSSFGAGGANAHVILEEYLASPSELVQPDDDFGLLARMVPLSANSPAQLQIYLKNLVDKLSDPALGNLTVSSIAYTLQIGRVAMNERIIFEAETLQELVAKLTRSLEPSEPIEGVYRGSVKRPTEANHLISDTAEGADFLHSLLVNRKIGALSKLWVQGANINWSRLHGEQPHPKRVSLPTYPFLKERYWIADASHDSILLTAGGSTIEKLHPLIHKNISTLSEQKFCSKFTGKEFFLADHYIQGKMVLPGVVHLEMGRAAGALAGQKNIKQMKDLVWAHLVGFNRGDERMMFVTLFPNGDDISYEITSTDALTNHADTMLHSQGTLVVGDWPQKRGSQRLDFEGIRNRCPGKLSRDQVYESLQSRGIFCGPTLQSVQGADYSENEALVPLIFPESCKDVAGYFLHPSMIDPALQIALGLEFAIRQTDKSIVYLPFTIGTLTIYDKTPMKGFVYMKYRELKTASETFRVYDIDITDAEGYSLIEIRDFKARALMPPKEKEKALLEAAEKHRTNATQKKMEGFEKEVAEYLMMRLSETIKLPVEKISQDQGFDAYGIDSVMVVGITRRLEQDFGTLSKTLFFEYQTISELTQYFIKEYGEKLITIVSPGRGKSQSSNSGAFAKIDVVTQASMVQEGQRNRFRQSIQAPQKVDAENDADIAVIGLSGRYPKSPNLDALWKNLAAGVDCIEEIPAERWDWKSYYDATGKDPNKPKSKWGGFLTDVDAFDPLFFNISPKEAVLMAPEERLFLEESYKALSDAGYKKGDLEKVGVYVGAIWSSQYQLLGEHNANEQTVHATSVSNSSVANRVSYYFNFHGPSMAIDTMCSSSLVAAHLACESIRRGECNEALVGGVNLSLHPSKYVQLNQQNFLSTDGRCRSFGAGGTGYVPGEAVGVMVLKSLRRAIEDGDHIYGVIKKSILNHGGKTNGYTVPNPNLQYEAIRDAIRQSHIDPRDISYVEAHGTGTDLGDPIEVAGLTKAFSEQTNEKGFCSIGSVKSNIGHCEAAAGIAGLTKIFLQMQHKQLLPSIHSSTLNQNIAFKQTPFTVQTALAEWMPPTPARGGLDEPQPRLSGISSFGAGGTNVHMIVEEMPQRMEQAIPVAPVLIILSAPNRERLSGYIDAVVRHLAQHYTGAAATPNAMRNIAYTLQVGRSALPERLALLANDIAGLLEKLRSFQHGQTVKELYSGNVTADAPHLSVGLGASGKQFIQSLVAERQWTTLAELWIGGEDIPWSECYPKSTHPLRVSLPCCPLLQNRYWITTQKPHAQTSAPVSNSSADAADIDCSRVERILQRLSKQEITKAEAKILLQAEQTFWEK